MDLGSLTLKLQAQVGGFLRDTSKAKAAATSTASAFTSAEAKMRGFAKTSTAVRDVVAQVENLHRSSKQLNAVLNSKAAGKFSPQALAALKNKAREVDGQLASLTGSTKSAGLGFGKLAAFINPTTIALGGITAAIATTAATVVSSVRTFAEFEQGMTRVGVVTGTLGTKAFEDLNRTALDLSATTEFTARQVADAMGFMGMAGFKASEIMAATPAVLQLASAGIIDVARAADITTNVMSGYGLEVGELERANNTLVATFKNSNTSLEMLGQSFKYVGPVARSAGVEFEELSAAMGVLGNAGIQAEMAGTGLRGAITRLLAPTKQQAKIMQDLGISASTSDGKLKSLRDIIGQLEKSGATTGQVMKLFGQRAGPTMQVLIDQGSEAVGRLRDEILTSGNIAQKIAEAQLNTFSGQIKILQSNVEKAKIEFAEGLVPTLRELVPIVSDLVVTTLSLAREALPLVLPFLEHMRDVLILISGNGDRVNAFIRFFIRGLKGVGAILDVLLGPLDEWINSILKFFGIDVGAWLDNLASSATVVGVEFEKVDQTLVKNTQTFKIHGSASKKARDDMDEVGTSAESTAKKIAKQRKALEDLLRSLRAANNKSGAMSPVASAVADFQNKIEDASIEIGAQNLLGPGAQFRAFEEAIGLLEDTLRKDLIKAVVDVGDDFLGLARITTEVQEAIKKNGLNLDADQILAAARQLIVTTDPKVITDAQAAQDQAQHMGKGALAPNIIELGGLSATHDALGRHLGLLDQRAQADAARAEGAQSAALAAAAGGGLGSLGSLAGPIGGLLGGLADSFMSMIIDPIARHIQGLIGGDFSSLFDEFRNGMLATLAVLALFAPITVPLTIITAGLPLLAVAVGGAVMALGHLVTRTETYERVQGRMSDLFDRLVRFMEPFAEAVLLNTGAAEGMFYALKIVSSLLLSLAARINPYIGGTEEQTEALRKSARDILGMTFDTRDGETPGSRSAAARAAREAYRDRLLEDNTDAIKEHTEELKNAPSGFKLANARFGADTGEARRSFLDTGLPPGLPVYTGQRR